MNKTQNYQLNQWEAEDKVRRVDFNADNAKIDAAIAAVDTKADGKADRTALEAEAAARTSETSALNAAVSKLEDQTKLHTIKTFTVNSEVLSLEMNVSSIDWKKWKTVHILFELQGFGVCTSVLNNGLTPGPNIGCDSVSHMVLYPMYRDDLPVHGECTASGGAMYGLKFKEWTMFGLYGGGLPNKITSGKITFFGEK